jgi:hypothetical protein
VSLSVCRGDFAGSTDFSDPTLWNTYPTSGGSPVNYGDGNLESLHPGNLSYVEPGSPVEKSQSIWEWTSGVAPITSSWTMSMGVANSVVSTSGTDAEIGFGIADTNNLLGDSLDLTLASFQGIQEFRLNLTTDGGTPTHYAATTSSQNGSILLWFDAPSDTLHAWYAPTPTDPNFTDLLDISLANVWNLQPTDTLTFFTIGASDDQIVKLNSDPAYGYNFAITNLSESPEPSTDALLLLSTCLGIFVSVARGWCGRCGRPL